MAKTKPSKRGGQAAQTPGWRLRFLYLGSADVGKDLAAYKAAGATVAWDKAGFGTRVAAVRLGPDPLLLLAGHRPSPSILPVFQVADLEAETDRLRTAGWTVEGEVFEVPNGPCRLFRDPSGNEVTLLQETRPDPFGTDGDGRAAPAPFRP